MAPVTGEMWAKTMPTGKLAMHIGSALIILHQNNKLEIDGIIAAMHHHSIKPRCQRRQYFLSEQYM